MITLICDYSWNPFISVWYDSHRIKLQATGFGGCRGSRPRSRGYHRTRSEAERRQRKLETLQSRERQLWDLFNHPAERLGDPITLQSEADARRELFGVRDGGTIGWETGETEESRNFSEADLRNMREEIIQRQDEGLDLLAASIARQKQMAGAINEEAVLKLARPPVGLLIQHKPVYAAESRLVHPKWGIRQSAENWDVPITVPVDEDPWGFFRDPPVPMDDSELIKHIRSFLVHPTAKALNLSHPEIKDPSEFLFTSQILLPTIGRLQKFKRMKYTCNPRDPWEERTGTISRKKWTKVDEQTILRKGTRQVFTVVECYPLYSLLVASGLTSLDYLSLDLEGVELKVLKTLPWNKVDIKVIGVEAYHTEEGGQALEHYMKKLCLLMSSVYAEGLSKYANKGKLGLPEIFDASDAVDEKVLKLAELIKAAKTVVVHTGAGISTSAGIPDFRGPNGVWTLEKRGERPTIDKKFEEALPTKTHMALFSLYKAGFVNLIVSQNVDGLHLRSGLPRDAIVELHGNILVARCDVCKQLFVLTKPSKTVGQKWIGEYCPAFKKNSRRCRGRLFDTVLDWDADLPADELYLAESFSEVADVSLTLGTTLQIIPSGCIPLKSKKLVICNLQKTKFNSKAELVIHAFVDDVMEKLCSLLGVEIMDYNPKLDPFQRLQFADEDCILWNVRVERIAELAREKKPRKPRCPSEAPRGRKKRRGGFQRGVSKMLKTEIPETSDIFVGEVEEVKCDQLIVENSVCEEEAEVTGAAQESPKASQEPLADQTLAEI
ncbi:unnamed protein product [Notodromas monacha]|uniref:protein acetyllysine N-acetyltransferase n=1 Tax=Notodromas monacha TaxID=399045 RepID=A0A7R9BPD9_9CRUS|nr:unnamed protein product [Notodromas monacha]CAG0917838.1 unnamed protein product [Notodromas monacha]